MSGKKASRERFFLPGCIKIRMCFFLMSIVGGEKEWNCGGPMEEDSFLEDVFGVACLWFFAW